MEELVALIDKIIEEHKMVACDFEALETSANDACALIGLEEAKETFVPGRFDQKQGLNKFQEMFGKVDQGLRGHFDREETALLAAFEKHGDRKLVTALRSLLFEHEDLRNRLDHTREHIAELINAGMGRHKWEASAHDMRAHLSHTRKLLAAHAAIESELLVNMRRSLKEESGKKEEIPMPGQVTLSVNDVPIKLDYFVHDYIKKVIGGMMASLKDTGEIKNLELSIDNQGQVKISLNGADVSLKPFPNDIIKSTVLGVVAPLKGVGEISRLELTIS